MELSPIQKCYSDSVIFITGGTGFLGTVLVEKLLRTIPNIKKIYLLIRDKKNVTPEERFRNYFADILWDNMKSMNPNYKKKVSFIKGDLCAQDFSITKEDLNLLIDEVTHLFHLAATVRFDEPIKRAAVLNIQATKFILDLALKCKNLKSVVYVSTCYSQCVLPELEERFYEPKQDSEEFLKYCENESYEELNKLTPQIIGKYPNTYTFTKSLAENLVKKYEKKLPITIFRPSIVLGIAHDPIPGWTNSFYGPVGAILGIAFGVVRVVLVKNSNKCDFVPVDMCANGMIAAGYNVSIQDYRKKDIKIYNFGSGKRNPIIWKDYFTWFRHFGDMYPAMQAMWMHILITTENSTLFTIYEFFLHTIPSYTVDTILKLNGKEPKLSPIYNKISKLSKLHEFFKMHEWTFHDDNVKTLYEQLDKRDQIIYPFDIAKLEWDRYIYHLFRFIRVFIMKEPVTNVYDARNRRVRFQIAHYSLIILFLGLGWLFLYFLYNIVF